MVPKMTNIKKMLRSYHLKSSLNVQLFISAHQIWASFAQIEYIFAKRYSSLETAGYPVVEMLPKLELIEHQRKQTFF
jgi:hypothetical protein